MEKEKKEKNEEYVNIQLRNTSNYGSEYYDVYDDDGCHALVRVATHPQKDHNRSSFGGVNYNLYSQHFANDDEINAEFKKLIKRTHEKKYATIKPKSKWIKPYQALEEYHLDKLPENLIWYKQKSPTRASILRESIEAAIKNKKVEAARGEDVT